MPAFIYFLVLHGLMASVDVILNHELLARLPHRVDTRREELLHALREALFTVVFLALALATWHGSAAWLIWILLVAEVVITTCDVKIEGDTRVLPVPERILHLFLFINLGALIVLLSQELLAWRTLQTGVAPVHYGWSSWLLSALGLAAGGWAVRDAMAYARLGRRRAASHDYQRYNKQ